MPLEPLRFVHATGLFLDRQLAGTGPVSDGVRTIIEEATLRAFEHTVAASIDRQADFLLLAGNCFDETDRSLRARGALIEGFNRLDDHGIRVFIMPGEADPAEAWQTFPELPDNVTLFFHAADEPVAVLRDGKVIAAVGGTDFGESIYDPPPLAGRNPFSIVLLTLSDKDTTGLSAIKSSGANSDAEPPGDSTVHSLIEGTVDYLALGGGNTRRTLSLKTSIAHNPGATQGLTPHDTGPHGCTLVDVDSKGTIQCTFLPTASVRWEAFTIEIDERTNSDELVRKMRTSIGQCRPESSEKVWLVNWTIHGSGQLFEQLHDEEFRRQLVEPVGHSTSIDRGLTHLFRLLPDLQAVQSVTHHDGMAAEYFETLETAHVDSADLLLHLHKDAEPTDVAWSNGLQSLIGELDHDVLRGRARRLGIQWFGTRPAS